MRINRAPADSLSDAEYIIERIIQNTAQWIAELEAMNKVSYPPKHEITSPDLKRADFHPTTIPEPDYSAMQNLAG